MCATLAPSVAEFTLPIYSSINLGLFPADWMRLGAEIRVGNVVLLHGAMVASP